MSRKASKEVDRGRARFSERWVRGGERKLYGKLGWSSGRGRDGFATGFSLKVQARKQERDSVMVDK